MPPIESITTGTFANGGLAPAVPAHAKHSCSPTDLSKPSPQNPHSFLARHPGMEKDLQNNPWTLKVAKIKGDFSPFSSCRGIFQLLLLLPLPDPWGWRCLAGRWGEGSSPGCQESRKAVIPHRFKCVFFIKERDFSNWYKK